MTSSFHGCSGDWLSESLTTRCTISGDLDRHLASASSCHVRCGFSHAGAQLFVLTWTLTGSAHPSPLGYCLHHCTRWVQTVCIFLPLVCVIDSDGHHLPLRSSGENVGHCVVCWCAASGVHRSYWTDYATWLLEPWIFCVFVIIVILYLCLEYIIIWRV